MVNNMFCCVLGIFSLFHNNYFETLATPAACHREYISNYQTTVFAWPFGGYELV